MIFIKKGEEPEQFAGWKRDNPSESSFGALTRQAKESLQLSLLEEQGGVCCFCGDSFKDGGSRLANGTRPGANTARVAHIIPQADDGSLIFEYTNLCLSCSSDNGKPAKNFWHCDKFQEKNTLQITPLMEDCLSYFFFDDDGSISANLSKSENSRKDAATTIAALNLNVGSLKVRRRSVIKELWDILFENQATKEQLIEKARERDNNNQFMPFYFVIVSKLS